MEVLSIKQRWIDAALKLKLRCVQNMNMENQTDENIHWSLALKEEMKNEANVILSSALSVVLFDTFPKAKYHYLVLPRDEVDDIYALTRSHLPLLKDMLQMAHKVISMHLLKAADFLIGFHHDPSMKQLHLHVISKDFIADAMKKSRHWLHFHTEIFVPHKRAYEILKKDGFIQPLKPEKLRELREMPLKCHLCNYETKNNRMNALKEHLLAHNNGLIPTKKSGKKQKQNTINHRSGRIVKRTERNRKALKKGAERCNRYYQHQLNTFRANFKCLAMSSKKF